MKSRNWSVLFVCPDATWFKEHIVKSLEIYGCRVNMLIYGKGMGVGMGRPGDPKWHAERNSRNADLVKYARYLSSRGELDVVLFAAYDDFLMKSTIQELKALKCYLVNYHVDLPTQWYRVLMTANLFDVLAVAHKKYSDILARKGANVLFLPMAAVPPGQNRAVPSQDPPPQHVTYVGFATPFRREVIGFLVKRGIPIRVHGKGWLDVGQTDAPVKGKMFKLVNDIRYYGLPRLIVEGPSFIAQKTASWTKNRSAKPAGFLPTQATGGSIPSEDLGAFYRNSAINLGIDGWDFEKSSRRDWGQVRLRDFEIPMAGGFFLAQAVPELDLHYDLDKEIAVWHNLDELEAKISYFLNNPQEAETIRENGHLRALRDHKWENRWDCLFGNLSAIERS